MEFELAQEEQAAARIQGIYRVRQAKQKVNRQKALQGGLWGGNWGAKELRDADDDGKAAGSRW